MAVREQRELYSYAMIDCSDMTLTEYDLSGIRTYDIGDILKRWDGVPNIEIEIKQSQPLHAEEE